VIGRNNKQSRGEKGPIGRARPDDREWRSLTIRTKLMEGVPMTEKVDDIASASGGVRRLMN
jgi:hypothetical protein